MTQIAKFAHIVMMLLLMMISAIVMINITDSAAVGYLHHEN
jgi:hypothetical protein